MRVSGVVQGVGFRPHAYGLARELGLSGAVSNDPSGVLVEIEGSPGALDEFCRRVAKEAPPMARVESVTWQEEPARGGTEFRIEASTRGSGRTYVSPDVATCADCLADLRDATNRRHRHPFVTCTNCGPRFTIITDLPYDRGASTMAGFAMCRTCREEYDDPTDRRFHAQPICCPACGPTLELVRADRTTAIRQRALAEARSLLRDGAVVAVKGLGGYHLACDATDEAAVSTLRKRKQRGDKPFAVMVRDLVAGRRLAHIDDAEAALVAGHHRPIVLLRRRDGAPLAGAIAPGSADVGLMLAYTPLHHLLLGIPGDPPGPETLVMTSANLSGEPLVTDDDEALTKLAPLADAWLRHDRPIHVPCDDSVARVVDAVELPVRRSRGYAPLPLALPFRSGPLLAVGGDLKNTFGLATGRQAWLSAHVGDMDDLATQQAFEAAEQHLEAVTGVRPETVVADLHPGYRTGEWAQRHASGRPVVRVQHHHAHVAATMAEHGHDGSRSVIGVAFDGTGYGDDGAAWGGEFLVADYAGYTRAAHLGYVPLPGGDAGVRHPCRMALSHLRSADVAWDARLPSVRACTGDELRLLDTQLERGVRCAPTSSMGRLFDAVASICGVCHRVGYEAQAAMELEALARTATGDDGCYQFDVDVTLAIDARPVVAAAAREILGGVDAATVSVRFHRGVAALVADVAGYLRDRTGLDEVTLSGGVFLNTLLTSWCTTELGGRGFRVLRHRKVPPSDAGLALGQIAVAAHRPVPQTLSPTSEEEPQCA